MILVVITCQVTNTVVSDKTVKRRRLIVLKGRGERPGDFLNFITDRNTAQKYSVLRRYFVAKGVDVLFLTSEHFLV